MKILQQQSVCGKYDYKSYPFSKVSNSMLILGDARKCHRKRQMCPSVQSSEGTEYNAIQKALRV